MVRLADYADVLKTRTSKYPVIQAKAAVERCEAKVRTLEQERDCRMRELMAAEHRALLRYQKVRNLRHARALAMDAYMAAQKNRKAAEDSFSRLITQANVFLRHAIYAYGDAKKRRYA